MHASLGGRGRQLLLSELPAAGRLGSAFHDLGVIAAVGPERVFRDTDRALEWAEDRLLAAEDAGPAPADELPLERMHVCDGLGPPECAALAALVERRRYGKGDAVMAEGDKTRELYMIARGTASVTVRLHGHDRDNRLATFSAGTVFGEMALLDDAPRSATVRADEDLVCYVLSHDAFERLTRERTDVAIRLLTNLARELAARLRRANRAISQLEG
jgi:CRP-like cAMP-binding protein